MWNELKCKKKMCRKMPYEKSIKTIEKKNCVQLTKAPFVIFESPYGYGVYTANAIQLAKMVNKIKYSYGLNKIIFD